MKKEDLFKQWEELKAKEEDIDCIILYIHMPTGEEEVIVNPNVVDKMQYIGKTYNDDLIHANCKDIYITDVIFSVNDDSCMDFEEALALMKEGHKVKLPSWGRLLELGSGKRDGYYAHERWRRSGYQRNTESWLHSGEYSF